MPGAGHAQYYLGIDGGASNIRVAIVDQDRQVVAESAIGRSANYHVVGMESVIDGLSQAVVQAMRPADRPPIATIDGSVLGLAGCNFPGDEHLLRQAIRRSSLASFLGRQFRICHDAQVALFAATEGDGIVVIAGTGSNCYGQFQEQQARAGGVDYILSDEGSSYDIGLRLLRAVVRSLDARGEATSLTNQLYEHLGVSTLEGLYTKIYADYRTKEQIASLAPLVTEAEVKGDLVARDILVHSVNELTRMVDAVINQLQLREQSVPVVMTGSLFQGDSFFVSRFKAELKRVAPLTKPDGLTQSAAIGAAWMACREGA
jgi:N-acetylglucosamine kinase-like BadF-type ATPase